MFQKKFYYLVKVQFLGYRFHGWQKQPNTKTVHLMIDRTLNYILGEQSFKTLGASIHIGLRDHNSLKKVIITMLFLS